MDENSQFNLEIRIVDSKSRGRWYCLDKVVDADFTNLFNAMTLGTTGTNVRMGTQKI